MPTMRSKLSRYSSRYKFKEQFFLLAKGLVPQTSAVLVQSARDHALQLFGLSACAILRLQGRQRKGDIIH